MNPTQENPSQELDVIDVAVTSAQKQALAGTITINLVFPQVADAIGQDDAFRDHLEKVVVSTEGGDAGAPFPVTQFLRFDFLNLGKSSSRPLTRAAN